MEPVTFKETRKLNGPMLILLFYLITPESEEAQNSSILKTGTL